MPAPAGTGLNRRSFLLRSGAAMLSVYGASKLRLRRARGGDRPGGRRQRPRAGLDLPRRRHRLALGARADRRPDLPQRCARAWRCRRAPGRRSPRTRRLRWNPGRGGVRRPAPGGQDARAARRSATRAPTSRTSPRATTGRSAAAAARDHRLDGPAARRDRHPGQPAPGAVASTARSRRRWRARRCRWRRSTAPPTTSGREGVWGKPEELMFGAVGELGRAARGVKDIGLAAAGAAAAAGDAAEGAARAVLGRRRSPPPVAYPGGRRRVVRREPRRRWRRCSPPGCRSAAPRSRPRATFDTHDNQAESFDSDLKIDRRLDRRLPGRPRGARARRPRASPWSGRSSAAARRRTTPAPTTAPAAPRS